MHDSRTPRRWTISAGLRSGLPVFAAFFLFFQTVPSPSPDSLGKSAELPPNLEPAVTAYPGPLANALRSLGRGVRNYADGKYDQTLQDLEIGDDATGVDDYVLLFRAKAAMKLGRSAEAVRLFRLLQSRYPSSPAFSQAVLGEAEALLQTPNPRAALTALENPRLETTSEALYLRGRVQEAAGRREDAVALYQHVYWEYVNSEFAAQAQKKLSSLAPSSLTGRGGYRLLLRRTESLLRAGREREARTLLVRLAKTAAPDRASSEKRAVLMAETEYELGKGAPALSYLKGIGEADPDLHARSLYLKGVLYRRTDDEASFLDMRDQALRQHAASPWTESLLLSAATYFDVKGDLAGAQAVYTTLHDNFPKGRYAERALWKVAFYSYALRHYEDALRSFWRYLTTYPDSSSPGAPVYWMGRCYENIGDTQTAVYLYERASAISNWSYYGQLAATAGAALKNAGTMGSRPFSGIDAGRMIETVNHLGRRRSVLAPPGEAAAAVIERARQLVTADLQDLAISELRAGVERLPAEKALSYTLARIHEQRGDTFNAIVTLRRAFPDYDERPRSSLPREVWELLFPVRHWESIASHAARNNVDPALVLGLIRQESAFSETARSSANARGLMQVLPSTGRMLARDAGVARYNVRKLSVAEPNIALGTRHLASLLEHFEGKTELALAAYNAGENRAERWRGEFGNVDLAEFVERIPFSETRGYVKQVLTNRAHYAQLTAPAAAQ